MCSTGCESSRKTCEGSLLYSDVVRGPDLSSELLSLGSAAAQQHCFKPGNIEDLEILLGAHAFDVSIKKSLG